MEPAGPEYLLEQRRCRDQELKSEASKHDAEQPKVGKKRHPAESGRRASRGERARKLLRDEREKAKIARPRQIHPRVKPVCERRECHRGAENGGQSGPCDKGPIDDRSEEHT